MSRGGFAAGIRLFRGWKRKTPEVLIAEKLIEEGRTQFIGSKGEGNILEVILPKPVKLKFLNRRDDEGYKFLLKDVHLKLYVNERDFGHKTGIGIPMEKVSAGVVLYTGAEIIGKFAKFTVEFSKDPYKAMKNIAKSIYMEEVTLRELDKKFKVFHNDLIEIKTYIKGQEGGEGKEIKNKGLKEEVSISDLDKKFNVFQRDLKELKTYIKGQEGGQGKEMKNKGGLKDEELKNKGLKDGEVKGGAENKEDKSQSDSQSDSDDDAP